MNQYTTEHALKVENALKGFISKHKQYRDYDVGLLVVEKVWNRGMGSAPIYRVNPSETENVVYAARGMFTKCDERYVGDMIDTLNKATGKRFVWRVVDAEPYPSMRIRIPNN